MAALALLYEDLASHLWPVGSMPSTDLVAVTPDRPSPAFLEGFKRTPLCMYAGSYDNFAPRVWEAGGFAQSVECLVCSGASRRRGISLV